jgi:hypothetical protein
MFLFLGNINVFSQSEDEKINRLVEQKIAYNKNNKSSIVYKIQIYNGNEKEAYKTKQTFSTLYPDYTADIVYNAPEWKTQVGKFKTRLEADKILKIIKQDYTGAIVLEDKI